MFFFFVSSNARLWLLSTIRDLHVSRFWGVFSFWGVQLLSLSPSSDQIFVACKGTSKIDDNTVGSWDGRCLAHLVGGLAFSPRALSPAEVSVTWWPSQRRCSLCWVPWGLLGDRSFCWCLLGVLLRGASIVSAGREPAACTVLASCWDLMFSGSLTIGLLPAFRVQNRSFSGESLMGLKL